MGRWEPWVNGTRQLKSEERSEEAEESGKPQACERQTVSPKGFTLWLNGGRTIVLDRV
jgi:hypothetical protein